jgi:hypothetical protein
MLSRGGRTSFKKYKVMPPAPKEKTYTMVMIKSENGLDFNINFSWEQDDKKGVSCQ